MRPHSSGFGGSRLAVGGVLSLWLGCASGCAHRQGPVTPLPASQGPVTSYEMEPIKITAVPGPDGTHLESFDAAELFEQAGKALSEKRFDDAIAGYDRLLKEFPEGRYTRAGIYNSGLACQGKQDWEAAIARFTLLADQYPDSSDAKDALFQLGASYAEVSNWPTSAQVYARVLDRKDLTADDRLEALSRRGYAQFELKDLDTAERTFRSAVAFFHQIETVDRLETDFYLALAMYHLGQVSHERFRAVPLRLPERQMSADLDEKARLLLASQREYIDTIKLGNPAWASASGFQIASLYEELYDAFIHAPVPPELLKPEAREKLDVYYQEVRKKIRVLLEKSVRTHEANLLMMERFGVENEWRAKSRLAYAKIQRLLDPSAPTEFAPPVVDAPAAQAGSSAPDSARGPGSAGPPIPTAPPKRDGIPGQAGPAPEHEDSSRGPDGETRSRPAAAQTRQIL